MWVFRWFVDFCGSMCELQNQKFMQIFKYYAYQTIHFQIQVELISISIQYHKDFIMVLWPDASNYVGDLIS